MGDNKIDNYEFRLANAARAFATDDLCSRLTWDDLVDAARDFAMAEVRYAQTIEPTAGPLVDRNRDFDEIQDLVSQCNAAIHEAFSAVVRGGETPGLYEAAGAVAGWAANLGYAIRRTEQEPMSSKKIIAWATVAAAKTIAATFGAEGAADVELILPTRGSN